ncbi:hypothetical protein ACFFSW_05555 [Saccharothrix longispora]|uniref:Uncharacterized protein n=1 Tax=Saccharothrix longispora TaxID=33920 RepID=A0ABU1PY97_9PSEU|nr:hypothetical protein [Saccharothrix longispora]MDR6595624.1 hypothetical protein [Saccharothrix longispora]
MGLAAAGVAVLAAGVVIGRWDAWSPSPRAASLPATSAPAAGPGAIRLADLEPVGSTSVDEAYAESPWQVAAARVSGVEHRESISASGAWCSSARLEFAVEGEYERLTARVAIADDSQLTKALDFHVPADGGGCPGPERVGVWVGPSLTKAGPASG